MDDFTFENQGTSTYLVCNLTRHEIDSMSLGMITNNRIPGFAAALYTQQDEQKYMKYNVTARVTLQQFFSGIVNKKQLLGVFTSIAAAFLAAEEYMLDANCILLQKDAVYVDVTSCKAEVICVPVLGLAAQKNDLGSFFKEIMFNTQLDADENCGYVARLINYLNSAPSFSLTDFAALLGELSNMTVVLPPNSPYGQPGDGRPAAAAGANAGEAVTPHGSQAQSGAGEAAAYQAGRGSDVYTVGARQQSAPEFIPAGGRKAAGGQAQAKEQKEQPGDEKMSLWYLMQHYNRENARRYKEQKAAEKAQGTAAKTHPAKPAKPEKKDKKQDKKKNGKVPGSIAIPGQTYGSECNGVENGQVQVLQNTPVITGEAAMQPQVQVQSAGQTFVWPAENKALDANPGMVQSAMPAESNANFGETTVLNRSKIGETTVLSGLQPQSVKTPYLIRERNHEKISLNRPVFRIGKEKSFVDYFVGDNTAVSRSHASFLVKGAACYVMDTNSTNHTFVNGRMIESNQEVPLLEGDRISLADEEFVFRML